MIAWVALAVAVVALCATMFNGGRIEKIRDKIGWS